MRQMISGLIAAIAVVGVSAAPASACGLFTCGAAYVAPVYSGCNTGCGGGWAYERLPDPVQQYYPEAIHQYYYADQGPTFSGPGNFAPYPTYRESALPYYRSPSHPHYWGHPRMHYGYASHHSMRYGYYGVPHHYGYREHVLRRYY
jgi:hypothetical protein